MGFPDILIRPTTLYRQMVEELRAGTSDVVLGVMPTRNPSKVDVVEITDDIPESVRPGLAVDARINPFQETPQFNRRTDRYQLDAIAVGNRLDLLPSGKSEPFPDLLRDHDLELG